jgi:hypothetical protein
VPFTGSQAILTATGFVLWVIGIEMNGGQLGLAGASSQTEQDNEDGGGPTVSSLHRWRWAESGTATFWQFSELL